jgi:hypothetical protein
VTSAPLISSPKQTTPVLSLLYCHLLPRSTNRLHWEPNLPQIFGVVTCGPVIFQPKETKLIFAPFCCQKHASPGLEHTPSLRTSGAPKSSPLLQNRSMARLGGELLCHSLSHKQLYILTYTDPQIHFHRYTRYNLFKYSFLTLYELYVPKILFKNTYM